MLMRTDPFRDLSTFSRLLEGAAKAAPMDAYRVGDVINVELDLPGIDLDRLDIQVERGELRVTAPRRAAAPDGAQHLVRERTDATITRRVMLGDVLDVDAVDAEYADGVLHLRIPLRDTAKPKQISVRRADPATGDRPAIEVGST